MSLLIIIIICSFTLNHVFSQNLVKNPGFETGILSPFWQVYPSGSTSVSVESNNQYDGNYCAKLTGSKTYLYQTIAFEPNKIYTLKATIKTQAGQKVSLGVKDFGGGEKNLLFSNTIYKTDSIIFETNGNLGVNPEIYLWIPEGSGNVWVDNVVLTAGAAGEIPDETSGFHTYYVSPSGNDNNTGLSPSQAWQTIEKVNNKDFEPGDSILFEGGQSFNGSLFFNTEDSGKEDSMVYIGSYESGRAIINALNGPGITVSDCKFMKISDLVFTGSGRNNGNVSNGVTFMFCSDITVDNIEVSGFRHSGLTIRTFGKNFQVTHVGAHDNGFAGIFLTGPDKTSLSDIYIGYCSAYNNPGDPTVLNNHSGNGILGYNVKKVTIEYCEASNNGWDMLNTTNGPGGIWVAEADSVIIQHCISHDNKTSNGAKDGLGFDLDGGTTNSIIQYCLSYNNQGVGFGIFQYSGATKWNNNTIRYCISENDGNISADGSVEIWNGTQSVNDFNGLEFYNNVIYNSNGKALHFLDHKNTNFNFRNNIFVSGTGKVYDQITGENFQGNNWFSLSNNSAQDSLDFIAWAELYNHEMLNDSLVGIYANPRFINPGFSTLTDPLLIETVDDYKLESGSVAIDKALDLETLFNINPGNRDYFGIPINKGMSFNMGIDQFADKQEISLGVGWNIFSANLVQTDSNLMNILQPLINTGQLKKVMDETGNTIENRGVYGGWTNGIGNIKTTEGYAINVTSPSTLKIYGKPGQLPIDIPLVKGWNIMSWPLQNEQDGMDIFQLLIGEGKLKKVMDQYGNTIEDWGAYGGWLNNIGNLIPGQGYKVNVTGDCSLTLTGTLFKSQKLLNETEKMAHFAPAYYGNGINHMNINVVNLPAKVLNIGDELAVFEKDICVGAVKIQDYHLRNFSVSIVTSASDNAGMIGFTEGNSFSLKLWDSRQKREIALEPEILKGSSTFAKNESTFVSLEKYVKTGTEGTGGSNLNEINCYPNPFSDEITIEIGLENDSKVQVEVLNQLGQQVKMLFPKNGLNKGNHQIGWNGKNAANQTVPAGIYLVRAIIGDNILYKKVICQ